jgi:hypothetical protein
VCCEGGARPERAAGAGEAGSGVAAGAGVGSRRLAMGSQAAASKWRHAWQKTHKSVPQ